MLDKFPCDSSHIFWMLIVIGSLNAMSGFFDWLAKIIPGDKDDKIFLVLKNVLASMQKVIDFFTARGKR